MKKDVIAVFDIGKTNKKLLLFDSQLKIIWQHEAVFPEIMDDDAFPCDDADRIELWLVDSVTWLINHNEFNLLAINFSTYGATLAYISKQGERVGPFYNYLKQIAPSVSESVYNQYGGWVEFCRQTASPALSMLNSGFQLLWIKQQKPVLFSQIDHIMHLPQYLSWLFTRQVESELTSIGCHTAMWDFDHFCYHPWLADMGFNLPNPVANSRVHPVKIGNREVVVGIGIHDSSASLAPYLTLTSDPFVLISTGTWCITMNPFNSEPLTERQMQQDCLCYIGVHQKPVKSSRLFLGHIFDLNLSRLEQFFGVEPGAARKMAFDDAMAKEILAKGKRHFFADGVPHNYLDDSADLNCFSSFATAYLQFVYDIANLCRESMNLVIAENDITQSVYITGGFSRNTIFVRMMANLFPQKQIFTADIDNATALGAALMVAEPLFGKADVNLVFQPIRPF